MTSVPGPARALPVLAAVEFNPPGSTGLARRPLLVLGPSLGTSVAALWSDTARLLTDRFQVIGWDLPGHGLSPVPQHPFDLSDLAASVITLVDEVLVARGEPGGSFVHAGVSVAGAVTLHLLTEHPDRISAAAVICSGAVIGTPAGWHERADTIRAQGTAAVVAGSTERWFAPGFLDREPDRAQVLIQSLRDTDPAGYAAVCEALAAYDLSEKLSTIAVPVLAIAGDQDSVTPPASAAQIATGVQAGRLEVLTEVCHLAPAEAPTRLARLLVELTDPGTGSDHPGPGGTDGRTVNEVVAAGMRVRREVLGDAHVDRATAAATDLTAEFQAFITQYAWGTIWTRPGLDRRSRSLITLTALVARGHHEELAMHVRAARTNGVTADEIKELLLQTAIYCGVPDANTAFRIAQRALDDLDLPLKHPEIPAAPNN